MSADTGRTDSNILVAGHPLLLHSGGPPGRSQSLLLDQHHAMLKDGLLAVWLDTGDWLYTFQLLDPTSTLYGDRDAKVIFL